MSKDLTNSNIERQNILNNSYAVQNIQKYIGIPSIEFDGKFWLSKRMVANFFEIDGRTIERYLEKYSDELKHSGYVLMRGKRLKEMKLQFAPVINVGSKGKPCFQGREYNEINKSLIRYFDPDTFEILESDLPSKLNNISEDDYQNDYEFVKDCYYEDGNLKETVSDKEKHTLRLIFKDVAYRQFICKQEEQHVTEDV